MRSNLRLIAACAWIIGLFTMLPATPAFAQSITVTASPSSAAADLESEITVTAAVVDAYNQPVSGEFIEWSGSGSFVFTNVDLVTNVNGIATAVLVDDIAETISVGATATTLNLYGSDSMSFTASGNSSYVKIEHPTSGATITRGNIYTIDGEFTPGTGVTGPYLIRVRLTRGISGGHPVVKVDDISATFTSTPSRWGPFNWTVPNDLGVGGWSMHAQLVAGSPRQTPDKVLISVN